MDKENTSLPGASSDRQPGKLGTALANDGNVKIETATANRNNRLNLQFKCK